MYYLVTERPNTLSFDPKLFTLVKNLSIEEKMSLIRKPFQPEKHELPGGNFPQEHGHRFNSNQYYKSLPNGGRLWRDWLSYSLSSKRFYCLHCMFFGKNAQKSWIYDGFHAWQRLMDISVHEKTEVHINASIVVKMKCSSMAVLPQMYASKRNQVAENREIVHILIDITLFLGQHSLPFRGHREGWSEQIKGNFKDLVKLLCKFSPTLAVYIDRLQIHGRNQINFISWQRQNQLINSVSKCIKKSVKKELDRNNFFSVSIDTTFDSSRREQLAFIIRYVCIIEHSPVIRERLFGLKETSNTTGRQLFSVFQDICIENDLDWKLLLVGQSYDGASNMRGEYEGLQALIREINPAAIYTWCYAHRLSLVVVQMSSCSANAVDTFGNLEQLYALISTSKKRVAIYENMQKEKNPKARVHRLKRVETTRWMSYSSALNTVLLTYDIVINTLEQIKITENADFKARSKATGLIDFFLSERFVLTAICYKNLFNILDPVTKMFQSQDIDLLGAVNSLQAVSSSIKRLRSDDAFNDLCNEATKFMNKSEFTFTSLPIQRSRKKKLLSGETTKDHTFIDPKSHYKIKTYLIAIDSAITCIEERFHSKSQELLKDISLFSVSVLKKTKSDPNTLPNDAFNKFCNLYSKFINHTELKKEYIEFSKLFSYFESTMIGSQCLHPSSATSDDKESSSDLEDSDEEEEKEDTVGLKKNNSQNLGTLLHVFKVVTNLFIYIPYLLDKSKK